MTSELSSRKEKHKYFDDHAVVQRWMYVYELKDILSKLDDSDWLTPNNVHNLTITRDGRLDNIGFVDFTQTELVFFDGT